LEEVAAVRQDSTRTNIDEMWNVGGRFSSSMTSSSSSSSRLGPSHILFAVLASCVLEVRLSDEEEGRDVRVEKDA